MKVFTLWVLFGLMLPARMLIAADALTEFSASMNSFTADFTQTVYDSDSVALQESSGQVALMRPGKFRWTYAEPVKQVIVADGLTLWVYDEDIQQVTMQPQLTTLGSAPIGLLSGQRAIESEFNIVDLGNKDGLHWFQLEPLVTDTDFSAVYIALDEAGLRAMELRDNFDQATQIRFTNFKKNAVIPLAQLQFEPPVGADVIGEAGIEQPAAAAVEDSPAAVIPYTEDGTNSQTPVAKPDELLEDLIAPETQQVAPAAGPDSPPESTSVLPEISQPVQDALQTPDTTPIAEPVVREVVDDPDREITFEEVVIPGQ